MSDALDRIRQRQRPKVAPRDATLTSQSQDIQTSRHTDTQDVSDSRHIEGSDTQKSGQAGPIDIPNDMPRQPQKARDQSSSVASACQDIQVSRHTDIKTSRYNEAELETKRSTFRLEAELIERLHTFSRRQGLSREVLIEAMFEYMEVHPDAMDEVVAQAQQKHEYRQQLANRKRAAAMMSKFGGA